MSVSAVAVSTLAPHGRVSARSKARATAGNAPPPVVSRAKRTKRTGARTYRARDVRAAANWDRDGKESRNPSLGAISDANATRGAGRVHDVSWVDLLSTEVNDPGGVPSDEKGNPPSSEDAADGAFAAGFAATVATNVDDTDDAPSAAAPPPPLPSGFFVRKERHEPTCDCPVCVSLRTLLHDAPTPVLKPSYKYPYADSVSRPRARRDPVFVGFDGGFVVGKQQQKHHVVGCLCPNCNCLRFRAEHGISKVVAVDKTLLFDLVGESDCFQKVLSAQTEIDRRLKIGAANKGKSAWNKGKPHSPETIAKIRTNTAAAMRDPEVKRRMREAAANTFHSATTKLKIRRTVRDTAHAKMEVRNFARAQELGPRRGKVGIVSIGTYARRVSSVQRVSFGVWSKHAVDTRESVRKEELRLFKKIDREERRRILNVERAELRDSSGKPPRSSRGVPKSKEHKLAISAALKAKWNDPLYVRNQQKSMKRRISTAARNRGGPSVSPYAAASQRAPLTESDKKRHKLVGEMKEMYTKASVAVRALEKRKAAGLEVDEVMLEKALSAVSETRTVLESLGQAAVSMADQSTAKAAAEVRLEEASSQRLVHMKNGERVAGEGNGETGGTGEDGGLDVA